MCGLLLPRLHEFSSLEKAAGRKRSNDIGFETSDER
jgi:hypothetical protein